MKIGTSKKEKKKKITKGNNFKSQYLGGDCMILFCRDEISTRQIGTHLTLRLH